MPLLFLALAGCGSGLLKPSGRLLKDGKPFVPGPNQTVQVVFFPVTEGKSDEGGSYPAEVNRESGTFRVVGANGKGLPPGKYRISVRVLQKRKDVLSGSFGVDNSPFVQEINGSTKELVLDLGKPAG
jgi:hypothetical protein